MKSRKKEILCLGWREWVALPDLRVKTIKAKIDTGAKTSALHAFDIKILKSKKSRIKKVKFTIHPDQDSSKHEVTVIKKMVDQRVVKSSTGEKTIRPVIETNIRIGNLIYPVELTLINRDIMGFRLLIGRQALRHRWLVDSGKSFLTKKRSK
jgi:hypothetical protein